MTNGDTIRNMKDEKLAALLANLDCSYCPASDCCNGLCIDSIEKWLNQEAESSGE